MRASTLTASASDRTRLDRPESSSFSFSPAFSVEQQVGDAESNHNGNLRLWSTVEVDYLYPFHSCVSCQILWMVNPPYEQPGGLQKRLNSPKWGLRLLHFKKKNGFIFRK